MGGPDPNDERHLPIVTRWMDLCEWLLKTTASYPKKWRPTLVQRTEEEALQVLLLLTEAAYRRNKAHLLREANLRLNRLRMLLELGHRVQALSTGAWERSALAVDEVGRMLGGWTKQIAARRADRP